MTLSITLYLVLTALKGREAALLKERDQVQARMEAVLADMTRQFEGEKKALEARITTMQEKQAAVLRLEKEMGAKQEAWERNNQGLQILLEKQRVRYVIGPPAVMEAFTHFLLLSHCCHPCMKCHSLGMLTPS